MLRGDRVCARRVLSLRSGAKSSLSTAAREQPRALRPEKSPARQQRPRQPKLKNAPQTVTPLSTPSESLNIANTAQCAQNQLPMNP